MVEKEKAYIAIDLKSFYASVECVERGLDPLRTNLVVADASRTTKTICLAVSPSLKSYGVSGRARLFEVVKKIEEVNAWRKLKAPRRILTDKSFDDMALKENPALAVDYIVARPRMALYMTYSTKIYNIYLQYVAPEDIHAYSVDEVFIDATPYLKLYKMTVEELAMTLILDVLSQTGITATAGIGTNLYLAKIAMDILAKHTTADANGVRMASLNEAQYRETMWQHRPLTDFWRVGKGYAKKLERHGLYTMGDIARCSIGKKGDFHNEALLYKLFGVNAELLIDHAWGWEPCTMKDIKSYQPEHHSLCVGQVLQEAYDTTKGRLVVREIAEAMSLDLLRKGMVSDQLVLTVGYEAIREGEDLPKDVEIGEDHYGRKVPKHAHGTMNLEKHTCSMKKIREGTVALYDRIVNPTLKIRRFHLSANHVMTEEAAQQTKKEKQLSLFDIAPTTDMTAEKEALSKERRRQETMLALKEKFGKNAIIMGTSLEEGATAIARNQQIGGHRA